MVSLETEEGPGSPEEPKTEPSLIPHAKLLGAIFGLEQYPIPPELEQDLIEAVEKQVVTLTEDELKELRLRFGLEDGITRTYEDVASKGFPFKTREEIRQIETQALRKLRHPTRSGYLRAYLSLPQKSFGREIFGASMRRDLPQFRRSYIGNLNLPTGVMDEMRRWWSMSVEELLIANLGKIPLSSQAYKEIARELVNMSKAREELVNHFLPQAPLTGETLSKISGKLLIELGVSTRIRNALSSYLGIFIREITVGDLLSLLPGELSEIRTFGVKSAIELGEKLQELLDPQQDKYPKDYIAKLLMSYFPGKGKEVNQSQEVLLRQLVDDARGEGMGSVEEIIQFLSDRYKRFFGISTQSWKFRALIEYVLNHPKED